MNPISRYFNREEFQCSCNCGFDTVDTELIKILDNVRYHFSQPVTINSGCRCATYNAKINGAPRSQHVLGRAADITVKDTDPSDVADYLDTLDVPGLGRYNTFTHVDSRTVGNARWTG